MAVTYVNVLFAENYLFPNLGLAQKDPSFWGGYLPVELVLFLNLKYCQKSGVCFLKTGYLVHLS